MARGINKWHGIGNCCADPEIRYAATGSAIVNITIACNDSYKDKQSGEMIDKTEFIRIVMFNKLAEIAAQYLKKGSQAYFEGRIQTRKWQDQSGQDRYTTEIVANDMQMLGGKDNAAQSNTANPAPVTDNSSEGSFEDIDIPFAPINAKVI